MGTVTIPYPLWDTFLNPKEPTELEKLSWELERNLNDIKRKQADQTERERKALYLIAEKLGIDINSL